MIPNKDKKTKSSAEIKNGKKDKPLDTKYYGWELFTEPLKSKYLSVLKSYRSSKLRNRILYFILLPFILLLIIALILGT